MPPRSSPSSVDHKYLRWLEARPNRLVAHYLMHCFLYYGRQTSVVSDEVFDAIVSALGRRWDDITHRHKALLDRGFLKSGFHIKDYPMIVQSTASRLLEERDPKTGAPLLDETNCRTI